MQVGFQPWAWKRARLGRQKDSELQEHALSSFISIWKGRVQYLGPNDVFFSF